ncbi:hypothetical protein AcV5_005733 [Taiwanofungus camphoratus]|nr:hypothetical protein AcV5_005733 [Antrodia cinnamomea]
MKEDRFEAIRRVGSLRNTLTHSRKTQVLNFGCVVLPELSPKRTVHLVLVKILNRRLRQPFDRCISSKTHLRPRRDISL